MIIDKEFQQLIPPLTTEEFGQLEESIIEEGCRDSLIVWEGILVDGHNRLEICQKHNKEYRIEEKEFSNREAAKTWIIKNQFGRRNLSLYDRGLLVLALKKLYEIKGKENMSAGGEGLTILSKVNSRKEAVKEKDISEGTLAKIEVIEEKATPEMKAKIKSGDSSISKIYSDIKTEEKRNQIRQGKVIMQIPTGEFNVIYADPPWSYQFSETEARDIENQYPTMDLETIKNINLPIAETAILFLWATAPKLEEAFQVLNAWGFTYKTCAVWDKQIIGMGYWFRGQHELLLVGTKGNFPAPLPEARLSSVFSEKRTKHSQKPAAYYKIIENMCPNSQYLEVFGRKKQEGWQVWGNEIL